MLLYNLKNVSAAVFTPEAVARSEAQQAESLSRVREALREALRARIPNALSSVCGTAQLHQRLEDLLGILQSEALNRQARVLASTTARDASGLPLGLQLVLQILDDILAKLFPELTHASEPEDAEA
jgi:hypothetical protein